MNSIRVKNFKSVVDSKTFELRPLTVLAGVNSSGKSSLLQALLLLKQTMDSGSLEVLKTTGPYVVANEPLDLARGKKRSNTIGISLNIIQSILCFLGDPKIRNGLIQYFIICLDIENHNFLCVVQ